MLDLSDLPLTLKKELEKVHRVEGVVMILVMRMILIIAVFTLMTKVLMTFTYMMTLIMIRSTSLRVVTSWSMSKRRWLKVIFASISNIATIANAVQVTI